ncbi:MAG: hypothetical protein ACP5N2_03125 [Candidatus Nanoarchaeia archaeon]
MKRYRSNAILPSSRFHPKVYDTAQPFIFSAKSVFYSKKIY